MYTSRPKASAAPPRSHSVARVGNVEAEGAGLAWVGGTGQALGPQGCSAGFSQTGMLSAQRGPPPLQNSPGARSLASPPPPLTLGWEPSACPVLG